MKDIDLAEIELRLISGTKDIHKETASRIFNVPVDKVTPEQRRYAKTINFDYFIKEVV